MIPSEDVHRVETPCGHFAVEKEKYENTKKGEFPPT